jgi:hypothetical protein
MATNSAASRPLLFSVPKAIWIIPKLLRNTTRSWRPSVRLLSFLLAARVPDADYLSELEKEYPAQSYFNMITGYKSGDLHLGRRTFLAAWLQVMQAWSVSRSCGTSLKKFPLIEVNRTGVTSVVVYAPTLFKIAGFTTQKV